MSTKKSTMRMVTFYLEVSANKTIGQLAKEAGMPKAQVLRRLIDAGLHVQKETQFLFPRPFKTTDTKEKK